MSEDDRDILDLLKSELDFIEKGGYGRSVRTPWLRTSVFQDSPSCMCYPDRTHDDVCILMQMVPAELKAEGIPCHFIPLNEKGDTIASLEAGGDQQAREEAMKDWLKKTIKQIEEKRAAAGV